MLVDGSTTITSATADFTGADDGAFVYSHDLPVGTRVASVTNSTTAVLTFAATATASSQPLLIGASVSLPALLAS